MLKLAYDSIQISFSADRRSDIQCVGVCEQSSTLSLDELFGLEGITRLHSTADSLSIVTYVGAETLIVKIYSLNFCCRQFGFVEDEQQLISEG